MATIYNPWEDPEKSPLAGEFLTPTLLTGETSQSPEMEGEGGGHEMMMKQALDTIMQQSTLIGQLTAKLAGK